MIQRCRTAFPLRLMCRLLQVARSGYYARQQRSLSRRAQESHRLTAAIRAIYTDSDGVYGSPKVWQVLRQQGEGCGKHRVARLMRREGLCGIPSKKRWKRRDSGERPTGISNQLARDFEALAPNTKWVTDITYSAPSLRGVSWRTRPKHEHVWNVKEGSQEGQLRYPLFATEEREPKRR